MVYKVIFGADEVKEEKTYSESGKHYSIDWR